MIHNLRDFLRSIDTASKRRPAGFTSEELASIRALSQDSPLFFEQIQRYLAGDSKLYARLSTLAIARERALPLNMGNVHDPLLAGPRSRTQVWFQEQGLLPDASKENLKEAYPAKQETLLAWVEESDLKARDKVILRTYIPFFFVKYREGATGDRNLFAAMAWAEQVPDGQPNERKNEKSLILEGLIEAAKAYEGAATKYYARHDYSCMPGLDERVLDVMTGIRISLEPSVLVQEPSPQKDYIAKSFDPFVTRDATGPKPTELFYALYLQAKYPDGFTVVSQPGIRLQLSSKDSERYAEAMSTYEQKIQADIKRYKRSVSETREDRIETLRLESKLHRYFQDSSKKEDDSNVENPFLAPDLLTEAIQNNFEALYDRYHELVFTETTLEEGGKLLIPNELQSIVESRIGHPYEQIQAIRSELQDHGSLIQAMSELSSLEQDFLESLCRLSGGSEEVLLGSLEAKRDQGSVSSEPFKTQDALLNQIGSILEGLNTLYNKLKLSDRWHTAPKRKFQDCLKAQLQEITASNANFIASEEQYIRILEYCILKEEVQKSLLCRAAEQGKTKFVQYMLWKSPSWISVRQGLKADGPTLLHLVARSGHRDTAKVLMEVGGTTLVNIKVSYVKNTVLHWAVYYRHKDIAELLIAVGGPELVEVQDRDGKTALHIVAKFGDKDIAELLIRTNRSSSLIDIKDHEGKTALHWAAENGHKDVIELFIKSGGSELVNTKDHEGKTALHWAVLKGNKNIAKYLIQFGGSKLWDIQDQYQMTALDVAIEKSDENINLTDIILLFVEHGCILDRKKSSYSLEVLSYYYVYNPTWQNYRACAYSLAKTGVVSPWKYFEQLSDLKIRRINLENDILRTIEDRELSNFKKYSPFIFNQLITQERQKSRNRGFENIEEEFSRIEIYALNNSFSSDSSISRSLILSRSNERALSQQNRTYVLPIEKPTIKLGNLF